MNANLFPQATFPHYYNGNGSQPPVNNFFCTISIPT